MNRHTEGKNTKQEEGGKKKFRIVAIFTERQKGMRQVGGKT